jgi:hypothetical protein
METQKLNLLKALHKFQSECPVIYKQSEAVGKDKVVKYKYADLSAIVQIIQPILTKCNLVYTQDISTQNDTVTVTTIIYEIISGESIFTESSVSISENKGYMTSVQTLGSLSTYLRRYQLSSILGLVTEFDHDGNNDSTPFNNTSKTTSKTTSNPPQSTQNQHQLNTIKPSTSIINQLKNDIVTIKESGKIHTPPDYLNDLTILIDKIKSINDIDVLRELYTENTTLINKFPNLKIDFIERSKYLKEVEG